MSLQGDRLRALYSGIPRPRRDRRQLMTVQGLQAYVDDSMQRQEALVLGGYIAPVAKWEGLTAAWQALLNEPPSWKKFSMRKIGRGKAKLRRAEQFYRLIEGHVDASLALSVDLQGFDRACRELRLDQFAMLTNPYLFAYRAMIAATVQHQDEMRILDPIDFIFDERGEEGQVHEGWEIYQKTIPAEIKSRLGAKPRFESDDDYIVLQAGDLFAWHVREHWVKHRSITTADIKPSWPERRAIPGHRFNFGYEEIYPLLKGIQKLVIDAGLLASPRGTVSYKVNFSYDPGPPSSDPERSS